MCSKLCLLFLFSKSIASCFIYSIFSQDQSSWPDFVMLSHEIFWLYRDYLSPGKNTLSMYLSIWVLWTDINICIWTVLWPVNITMAHQHCQGISRRLNTGTKSLISWTNSEPRKMVLYGQILGVNPMHKITKSLTCRFNTIKKWNENTTRHVIKYTFHIIKIESIFQTPVLIGFQSLACTRISRAWLRKIFMWKSQLWAIASVQRADSSL